MTLTMTGPFIQAKGYTRGRNLVERKAVNLLVIHTAQGATDEVNLGRYFAGTTSGSSHAGIGQDGGYAGYVNYADTCWAAPPMNQEADHLEICGWAQWTRAQWLAHMVMLEAVAYWIAWRCTVRRIPVVRLTDAQLKAGMPGVVDHDSVSDVWHASDHWDVGENFPWDVVMARAQQIAGVGGTAPTPTTSIIYTVKSGDTLTKIASAYKTTVEAIVKANGLRDADVLAIGQRLKVTPGTGTVKAPVAPAKTGVQGPYPLPRDHYFTTRSANPKGHSGYYLADQRWVKMIQQEVGAAQDGDYGPNTAYRVGLWQAKHGLRADRVVGPITWGRMAVL